MRDYAELVKALQLCPNSCRGCPRLNTSEPFTECKAKLNRDAADAIEELLAKDTNVPNKIVHCGECRFWDSPPSCEGLAKCVTGESGIRYRSKSDYCSKGMPITEPPKGATL